MDGLRGENRRLKAFMDVVSGVVEEDMSLVEAQAESRALKSEVEELQGKLQAVEGGEAMRREEE